MKQKLKILFSVYSRCGPSCDRIFSARNKLDLEIGDLSLTRGWLLVDCVVFFGASRDPPSEVETMPKQASVLGVLLRVVGA